MMTSRHWVVTSSVVCAVLLTRVASLRADTITILSPGTEPTNVSILADTFTLFGSSVSVDLDFLMSRGHFALPVQQAICLSATPDSPTKSSISLFHSGKLSSEVSRAV